MITPGIIENFPVERSKKKRRKEVFHIVVFGRAAREDRFLKGYDIIAGAVASLGEKFKLKFVGSVAREQREVENWFLTKTNIKRDQLTVNRHVDQDGMKRKLKESDLCVVPSRTEAFGLVALEAISAGVPVLISKEAGIAHSLQKVEGGNSVIVTPNDSQEWAKRILEVSRQKAVERHNNAILLREKYKSTYPWEEECKKFSNLIANLGCEGVCLFLLYSYCFRLFILVCGQKAPNTKRPLQITHNTPNGSEALIESLLVVCRF